MAKLTIEIEENEFALYDYTVRINDEVVATGENFVMIDYADDEAREVALEMARERWGD
jgi:hypothetical protein